MSSQEDYLDQLLQNAMTGENEQSQSEVSDETNTTGEILGMNENQETFEDGSNTLGTPAEDSGIEELLKSFEDSDDADEKNKFDSSDVSSMSEDEIDRLLAENRSMSKSSADTSEEAFKGDVMDLLEGTGDRELQEIQELLEKSDNNEAVGNEIEELLKGAVKDSYDPTGEARPGADENNSVGVDRQLSPRQQKALEKKRKREEKAAARKAKKEARKAAREAKKAEKAARKAAKKAGKGGEGAQAAQVPESMLGADALGEVIEEAGEPIDTAFLDSILSEAGKIGDAEDISSATGNYDADVDGVVPEEGEEASKEKDAGKKPSAGSGAGVDLDNLFGDGTEAEGAVPAGGGPSDIPGFESLDGGDVTGIIELAGGEEGDEESKPKKKGFFSRFMEFLTEEDEDEEAENENIKLSEENQEIIQDLDKEKEKEKDKKKGKKKGKKDKEKEKKKKPKKPKKEKPKKEEEPADLGKKLSMKKVLPVLLVCLSLGFAIIILVNASVDFTDRKTASNAYYVGDYQTCYQYLYGKEMNEAEQIMFGKSQSMLTIRMWIREYEMLEAEDEKLRALDSLIQSVNRYPALYEFAGEWNAAGEVAQEYATILNLLYVNYGLTEDQARAIAAEPDDIEYTRQVNAIVQGGTYGSWNEPEPVADAPLQDVLPEESELPENNFINPNAR